MSIFAASRWTVKQRVRGQHLLPPGCAPSRGWWHIRGHCMGDSHRKRIRVTHDGLTAGRLRWNNEAVIEGTRNSHLSASGGRCGAGAAAHEQDQACPSTAHAACRSVG